MAWDKPGGFIGHDALAALNAAGPPSTRLVRFLVLDPTVELFGHEVVCRDGREVGHLRYGTFGHTLGAACGQGMVARADGPVTTEWLAAGEFTLHVNGREVAAIASLRGFHDPDGLRYRNA